MGTPGAGFEMMLFRGKWTFSNLSHPTRESKSSKSPSQVQQLQMIPRTEQSKKSGGAKFGNKIWMERRKLISYLSVVFFFY